MHIMSSRSNAVVDYRFERADHTNETLQSQLQLAISSHNAHEQLRMQTLMATGAGSFDFTDYNLNRMVNITPVSFENWLESAWANRT